MTDQVIGHYRILERIGSGGMGEVFRAHDERLGRDVALKLVRASSSNNPDHVRRFEQEARAAAALNHPNIVAVYDVGVENGVPYIVSELLEGETLRQRLSQGPLPLRQVTDYALQIVQGLIAAHQRRIVHRDLKPENLFITSDGRVKILDFGVAKLQPAETDHSFDNLPTVTKSGAIVGTVAYMSPEQLRAKPVDHRADIFSVGAILYEMLAGARAFRGETEVDTISAVLREEPAEIDLEQVHVPQAFRSVVRHCLEKEPENRFQSAKDLAFALETLAVSSGQKTARVPGSKTRTANLLPWAIGGVLAAALLLLLGKQLRLEKPLPTYRRVTFENGTVYSARFAPNGRSIIYTAAWNGEPLQLFSTVGDSLLAQPLNFKDASLLAVSPSNELAVLMHGIHGAHLETSNGTLARAPLAGGSPREVLADVHWADWDAKGEVAVVHRAEGHSRLEYPVGHILYQSAGWISHIRFSPQGNRIAFMNHPAPWDDRGSVCVVDLSGHVTVLSKEWESEAGLAWSPDGNEIWFTAVERGRNRDLQAVNLSGRIRTLLDLPSALTLQDVSSDGRVLVTLNTERLAMAAATRNGTTDADLSWHDWNIAKDISGDGQWVLFEDASEAAGEHYAVAIRKLDGTPPIRLGEGSAGGLSPDGKWAISIFTGNPERLELLPRPAATGSSERTGAYQERHGSVSPRWQENYSQWKRTRPCHTLLRGRRRGGRAQAGDARGNRGHGNVARWPLCAGSKRHSRHFDLSPRRRKPTPHSRHGPEFCSSPMVQRQLCALRVSRRRDSGHHLPA
jgi:serine/threonine protein kinase